MLRYSPSALDQSLSEPRVSGDPGRALRVMSIRGVIDANRAYGVPK